jgi:transposase
LAADLKNDMVRQKLETIWQEQLMALENLKSQSEEIQKVLPELTVEQENRLRYLCAHFEEAFFHPSIDNRTRKRLIQCFLEKVILQLNNDLIHLDLYWKDVGCSVTTLTVQTPPYVYRYILSRYHQGLDEKAILEAMEIDRIGLPGKVFTRLGIASYIKDRGLESCTTRKRKKIESFIRQFYQDGLNAEKITERLNSQGIRTITRTAFTLVNTEKILRRLIRQEQKSPRQIDAKNWSIIKNLMEKGLDTHEIVEELNARGLKTCTGLAYSYRNLRKVMRRQGFIPPRKKQGKVKTELNTMFRKCRSEGLSSRQAIEEAIKEKLMPADDTMARKRAYDCYRRLGVKGAVIDNIPEDFRALIESLVSKGLDGPQIADELNRQGLRTIKGKSYQASTVQQYCRALGISLRQKRYLDDPALSKEIMVFFDTGKSCKQIADHLNAHAFKTFLGRDFKQEDIRSLLSRQALKASDHCCYDYIIKEIRPLVEAGYHPRTIGRKLNSMGMKTVTGQRFDTRKIKHYIRIMKSLDVKSAGNEVN